MLLVFLDILLLDGRTRSLLIALPTVICHQITKQGNMERLSAFAQSLGQNYPALELMIKQV